ncbi:hypothetical protein B0H16DRAFT_1279498, partial [Mycena metata]
SCMGYTGPFSDDEKCCVCKAPRYDPIVLQSSGGSNKVPDHKFETIPIESVFQPLWR